MLFTDYIAEHLTSDGRGGVIVPNGIVATTQNAYIKLRRFLVEDLLVAAVSLPAGVFKPYSGVKTSILLLNKKLARQTKEILFLKINADGFDLGDKRNPIEANDLPEAERVAKAWFNGKLNDDFDSPLVWRLVEKTELLSNRSVNISADPTNSNVATSSFPVVRLDEITEVVMGQSPPGDTYNEKGEGTPLINGPVEFGPYPFSKTIVRQHTTAPTKLCEEGDLILCVRGATAGRMNIAGFRACIGRGVAAIRAKERKQQAWVNQMIRAKRDEILALGTGSTFPNVSRELIASLEIPLPPLEEQQQIVAEIDGYQQVLDGARQILRATFPASLFRPIGRRLRSAKSLSSRTVSTTPRKALAKVSRFSESAISRATSSRRSTIWTKSLLTEY